MPISYAHPKDGSLGIAVIELPATGRPTADLVTNPGGPGASGLEFLEDDVSLFPASLRAHVNIVSFDPRGVGASDPVHCLSTDQERAWLGYDPDPTTPGAIAADVAQAKAFTAGCLAHNSRLLLANVGTVDAAQDLDQLRAALHQPRLDYLGFSYGTYLGELYAERFPHRVGRFVLDGVVDPAISAFVGASQQALGFQHDFAAFARWCTTNRTCSSELPDGAEEAWQALSITLAGGGVLEAYLLPQFGGTQPVDLGMAETGVIGDLYSSQSWPDLAKALSDARSGDGSELAASAYNYADVQENGSFSNETDANMAIGCVDGASPHRLTAYESLARRLAKVAPLFGPQESWGGLPCAYWPVPVTGPSGPVHAPGTPPLLVVGSTGDPATPYPWAEAVARQFPHGVLLTRRGEGHTAYGNSTCVTDDVDTFLETGVLPRPGTICPSS